jgi:hypothetical protein
MFQVMWPAFNLWHLLAAIFYYQWNQSLIDKLQTTRELKVCCCFLDRYRETRSGLELDFFIDCKAFCLRLISNDEKNRKAWCLLTRVADSDSETVLAFNGSSSELNVKQLRIRI